MIKAWFVRRNLILVTERVSKKKIWDDFDHRYRHNWSYSFPYNLWSLYSDDHKVILLLLSFALELLYSLLHLFQHNSSFHIAIFSNNFDHPQIFITHMQNSRFNHLQLSLDWDPQLWIQDIWHKRLFAQVF